MSNAPRVDNIETNIGILQDPTLMSDALATKLGLKQYTDADVTFSTVPTNWSVARATFIPYQTSDGAWRLRFNISATVDSTTTGTFTIDGITWQADYTQAGASMQSGGWGRCQSFPGSGVVTVTHEIASTVVRVGGDMELASKPTWAV